MKYGDTDLIETLEHRIDCSHQRQAFSRSIECPKKNHDLSALIFEVSHADFARSLLRQIEQSVVKHPNIFTWRAQVVRFTVLSDFADSNCQAMSGCLNGISKTNRAPGKFIKIGAN
ncbi:MAG TPA: hypothetical protein DCE31_10685 [Lautropia sp.]|nr:hypothetical protein [Lautropia sp.]